MENIASDFHSGTFMEQLGKMNQGFNLLFFDNHNVFFQIMYYPTDLSVLAIKDIGNPYLRQYILSKIPAWNKKKLKIISMFDAAAYSFNFLTNYQAILVQKIDQEVQIATFASEDGVGEIINIYQYDTDDCLESACNMLAFRDLSHLQDFQSVNVYHITSLINRNMVNNYHVIDLFDLFKGVSILREIVTGSRADHLLLSVLACDIIMKIDDEELLT